MRREASILHLDLDAFYAAVEQRDKPSLRGKPVVVGGIGPRGVVATASYEARAFGIHSAMPTGEARRRCPNAAFLSGRFAAYRLASEAVMGLLREVSPLVEPLSLDEAFVDLAAAGVADLSVPAVTAVASSLKDAIEERCRLTASVGVASSKLLAKIASDLDKPDGLVVVAPGSELATLHPLPVGRLWTVGPVTSQRLHRLGISTVGDLANVSEDELVALLGQAHGRLVWSLARADDDRPVVPERETKSIGAEETFAVDITDRQRLAGELEILLMRTIRRLAETGHSARTVTLKVRLHDFRTYSRSTSLPAPTDDPAVLMRAARSLLAGVEVAGGVRLLGVAVSGLSDHVQAELPDLVPARRAEPATASQPPDADGAGAAGRRRFDPGADVVHVSYGRGWVQGSGAGRVTVRFETVETGPGPIRTFSLDDADLCAVEPLPVG